MNDRVFIKGIPINKLDYDGFLDFVENLFSHHQLSDKAHVITVNPEMILRSGSDEDFYNLLEGSAVNTPDGIGVLWAAYYLSLPNAKWLLVKWYQLISSLLSILIAPKRITRLLPGRVTGSDLIPRLVDFSQGRKWKFFFLGAEKGVAEKAIKNLSKIYPDAQFVGCYSGSPDPYDEEEICDLINQSKANILLVAYGSPGQEFWIHRNLFKLTYVRLAIGVGGAFDFHAKKIKRAPLLLRKLGLEWLWRLSRQPSRFHRIWAATYRYIHFIYQEKNSSLVD